MLQIYRYQDPSITPDLPMNHRHNYISTLQSLWVLRKICKQCQNEMSLYKPPLKNYHTLSCFLKCITLLMKTFYKIIYVTFLQNNNNRSFGVERPIRVDPTLNETTSLQCDGFTKGKDCIKRTCIHASFGKCNVGRNTDL